MDIKHTILMITYNQEDYIRQALDSVLNQEVLPYEIVIGDDYSTDKTREIIMEYKNKFPLIIKPIFHEKNLGIYGNLNALIDKVSGDMIHLLAGDDWFEGEMLLVFNKVIESNKLDCKQDPFLLMPNFYRYHNNELELVNNYQYKNIDSITLKIQNLASNRGVGISRELFNTIPNFDTTIGPWADWLWDIGQKVHAKKIVFIDEAFPVYRVNVGITSKKTPEYFHNSYVQAIDKILEVYKTHLLINHRLFLYMQKARTKYFLNNGFMTYIRYVFFFILNLLIFKSREKLRLEARNLVPRTIKFFIKKVLKYEK